MTERAQKLFYELRRTLEMSANIMRDPKRTGNWPGARYVAASFDRALAKVEELQVECKIPPLVLGGVTPKE